MFVNNLIFVWSKYQCRVGNFGVMRDKIVSVVVYNREQKPLQYVTTVQIKSYAVCFCGEKLRLDRSEKFLSCVFSAVPPNITSILVVEGKVDLSVFG